MKKTKKTLTLLTLGLSCAGCNGAPAIDVLGSFFPAWMVCIIAAVVLAFTEVTRRAVNGPSGPYPGALNGAVRPLPSGSGRMHAGSSAPPPRGRTDQGEDL